MSAAEGAALALAELDRASRERALTEAESRRLERLVRAAGGAAHPYRRWTRHEDQAIRSLREDWGRSYAEIGAVLRRSGTSVKGRAVRLRALAAAEARG